MGTVKLEYGRAATPRNDRGIPGNCTKGVITSASWRPVTHQYLSAVGTRETSNDVGRPAATNQVLTIIGTPI